MGYKIQSATNKCVSVNQMFGGSSQLSSDYCRDSFVVCTVQDYRTLGRSRKLRGAAEQLIDDIEKTHMSVELSALDWILVSSRNWKAQYVE